MDATERAKEAGSVAKLYQLSEKEIREIADALMLSAGADYLAKHELEKEANPTPEQKEAWSALVRSVNRKDNLAKRLRDSDEGFCPDLKEAEERVIPLSMEGPDATLKVETDSETFGEKRLEWLRLKVFIPAPLTHSEDQDLAVNLGSEEARQLRNHLNDLLLHE